MANTLTGLIPDIYEALDIVSRELVGFVPAMEKNTQAERAAVGQNIIVDVEPEGNVSDITPAMTVPEPTAQTSGTASITITKARAAEFGFTGEEVKGLNTGAGFPNVRANKIAQAVRKIVNEIEADSAALHVNASRAVGTAGTTPFSASLADSAQVKKVLDDNGAPQSDRTLVIDTTAGANLRTLANLTDANRAGTTDVRALGELINLHGFVIRESAQVVTSVSGTGAGYLVNNVAGYAVGATQIVVDTGTGSFVPGDVITFAGDANQYVVKAWDAVNLTITLQAPGLRKALADNTAVTIVGAAARNLAFSRNALVLAARAPALPEEGDMAIDRTLIVDPVSGLPFEFAIYPGYRKVRYEVALAWGVACIKPEHTAILLG